MLSLISKPGSLRALERCSECLLLACLVLGLALELLPCGHVSPFWVVGGWCVEWEGEVEGEEPGRGIGRPGSPPRAWAIAAPFFG